jgi:sulfur-carrier protein
MVKVRFFTLLQLLLNKKELELESVAGEQVSALLSRVQSKIDTPFLQKLLDGTGELKTGTIILVNGKHVLHLQGLATPVTEGDEIALFPPGGGG